MDDLYGNLENYDEENRISELQAENKDLKCKLEDYAASVNKLQKDFDMLSSEYKKLETNYSSLLKTAKAEIERKTQIITNLNKEKDMMVLMHHQNKNIRSGQTRDKSKSMVSNNKVDVHIIPEKDTQPRKSESSRKESPCPSAERKEQDSLPTSSNPRSKLINLTNSSNHRDPRSEKNIESKENIQDRKVTDTSKTSASIRNRRKSMSALSIEKDKFSSDTDDPSEAIAKDQNFHHRQKHKDFNHHDRPKSRISETCSFEERKQTHSYETEYYNHRQRSSRYEEEPTDRYRARHKSANRYNRHSPDRYPDGPKDYYYRSHPDTHRSRRRDPESRMAHLSQDRYTTKRRTEHGYDGADSKRARLEPQYQHHELNQRMEDDRNLTNDRYLTDSPNIQFSSCESPDYDNLEFSQHQITEIKLTATTKLADPRVTSHKYIVEKDKGKPVLHTVAGEDVEIVPINHIAWGINPVSMPEALVKMPTIETDQSVKDLCKEIENRADTSIESGEITDREFVPSHENVSTKRKINNQSERKQLPSVPVTKVEDIENMKESLQMINNYKIPKLKYPVDSQYNKDLSSKRHVGDDVNIKADVNKQMLCVAEVNKLNEVNDIEQEKCNNNHIKDSQLLFSHHSEDRIPSAQEVVEGDLEMSDDNYDEKQSQEVVRETSISVKIPRSVVDNLKPTHTHKEEKNTVVLEPVKLEEPCHKKTKTKKKSKHKEAKSSKIENSEKPAKTTESKSNHIISKFTELFDDSCSLINPEDLGVESLETTTLMPASCDPFFEDAVNEMPTPENIPISAKPKVVIENNEQCDPVLALYDPDDNEADDKADTQTNSITEDDIESIYKNLEPGLPVQEENVQTVVISTGVQPVLAGEEELVVSGKSNQIVGVIAQDIALEALATSTPHKPWQPDALPADTDVKLSDAGCSSSYGSQKATVNNPIKDRSDNTMDSQTSEVNEPDVRIFAKKRRRKIAAKK